jgi:uncharacterized protein (TIGR00369 family)
MAVPVEIVRDVIVTSPYGRLLGTRLEHVETDFARVRLPFRDELATIGDVVHGGAISGLIDIAATAAAWSGAAAGASPRGTTVGFSVNFLAAGRGQDLVAAARVIRRGKTLSVCDVEVKDVTGEAVARALVTYKLG